MATDAQRSGDRTLGHRRAAIGDPRDGHGDAVGPASGRGTRCSTRRPGARRLGPSAPCARRSWNCTTSGSPRAPPRWAWGRARRWWRSVPSGAGSSRRTPTSTSCSCTTARGRRGDKERIGRVADALWYPLWDAGIGLDHSVRTVGEAIEVATTDLRVALGLLEVRHLAGDPDLAERLAATARQAWRAGIRNRFDDLVATTATRWERSGEVAHRIEPDLKNGHGGLRDIQLLDALVRGAAGGPAHRRRPGRAAADARPARGAAPPRRPGSRRDAGRGRPRGRGGRRGRSRRHRPLRPRARPVRGGAHGRLRHGHRPALGALRAAAPRAWPRCAARRRAGRSTTGWSSTRARWSSPATRRSRATRPWCCASPRPRRAPGCPIAAGTLHRLADAAPELREPWPRAALQRAARPARGRRGHGRRHRGARPHRPVGPAVPRVGRGARPAPARPLARLDRRPPSRRGHPSRRRADDAGVAPRPAAARRAGARHRQGPRRGPLRGRRAPGPPHRAAPRPLARGRRHARRDGAPPPAAAAHRVAPRPRGPGDRRARRRDPGRRPGAARAAARPRRGRLARHRTGRVDARGGRR